MSLTITIPGAVNVTTGATAPATLTIGVGVPGAPGAQGPAGPGVPAGGTAGQFLTKIDGTNYNTDWTTVNLSNYLPKSGGYITGDINSSNGSAYRSYDGTYYTSVLSPSILQLNNAGGGGGALSVEWNGITFASGKQTVHYPGTSILSGYATESWVTAGFAPIASGMPTSGTVGQVLTKNSGTDYDASWATLIPGDRYLTSSTTSLTVGNGTKSLTIGTGLSYSPQQDIVIAYDATAHMHAIVTSYDSGTGALVCEVQNHTGSGTYADWTVNVGGTTPLQSVYWGEILGTLGDQSDLATALNAKLETSTAASTYAALSGATFTGEVATPASTTTSAGFSIAPGVAPTTPQNGEIWNTGSDLQVRLGGVTETLAEQSWVTSQGYLTSSALTPYLLSSTAASTYQTISGMSSYLTTSAASTTYAALTGATFTGLVSTPAATTASAFLRIAHGAAPTTPVNGDVWTTTSGLFARINGGTQQYAPLGSTNTFTGTNTFSGATVSFGTSTAASTINIGTGATLTATTKAINIGTAGVSGSTTNIAIGSAASTTTTTIEGTVTLNGASLNLGNSTATGTINVASAATISGATKSVNVATGGATGSTTSLNLGGVQTGATSNIKIGDSVGTYTVNVYGTTTLNGTTTAATAAQNTNTTQLATTAFVLGQASSTTPLVDGTAAVGTATTFARADHVHPTDTSRAPLASPTFTGVPAAPTAAANTNTTQLATTAFVVGQAATVAPLIDGTAAVGTSLLYARQDHVHPTDTTRAPLASPTFTGTVTIPAGASISGYAPLASPTFTGTPAAPTATAGTNTTQIATTAFVTAAVPAVATNAQVLTGTSTTVTLAPGHAGFLKADPRCRQLGPANYTAVSGSGAITANSGSLASREMYLASLATGRAAYCYGLIGSNSILTSKADRSKIDFSKKIWLSGTACAGLIVGGTNYYGDANTVARISFGGYGAFATGDMSQMGIGWKKVGGTTTFVNLSVHNGTTLTNVATTFAPTSNQVFDWVIYSDGTGNVTLYINGTQVATTSAGPTGITNTGTHAYYEQVEAGTTPTVLHAMHCHSGWLYLAD